MTLGTPELSVVLATPDCYETIRRTVSFLRRQTASGRMQLVVVAPKGTGLELVDQELREFQDVRVVELDEITSIGAANAAGVRAAAASIVVFSEDHVEPDPDWASTLIAAHRGPWAAVGVAVRNANPESVVSWADLFVGYGPWLAPAKAGEREFLPGHNTSYKREVLLEDGPRLDAMLEAETTLHWDLRARGHRLYLEPAARIAHVNFARMGTWVAALYHSGRVFAATRAAGSRWSIGRRALYSGAAPLIPLVRLYRTVRDVPPDWSLRWRLLRSLPTLVFGLAVDAAGQAAGYVLGAGRSARTLPQFEFHRRRFNSASRPT